MKLNIAVLQGDGVGPEVTNEAVKALKAIATEFNHTFIFKNAKVGASAIEEFNNPLPEETLQLCKESDAVLFGAVGDPKYANSDVRPEHGLLQLRKELGLFANIRPVKAYDSLLDKSPLKKKAIKNADFCIYRELTSGIYFGARSTSEDGNFASDTCEYSKEEIERIAHLAFKAAQSRKNKVTLVDKANVLETSRLWRKTVTEVASHYPNVELDYLYVDNASMQMILNPRQFDIILTDNMFGDILSDEASVVGGSIGLIASASIGKEHALFEPIHGAMNDTAEKGIANPIASILSAAMLLDHFELFDEAELIRKAVNKSLDLHITTPDLNTKFDNITTDKVGDLIEDVISNPDDSNINFTNIHLGQSTII